MQKNRFFESLLKLAVTAALFYLGYFTANMLAAQRAPVPEIAFAWERHIPFLAWTVLPYWSLNLLYALAFFLCRSRAEQRLYMYRLLAAQLLAVSCFILFPLQCSWEKPLTYGWQGALFRLLGAFDAPYNQAPSLHIMLSLIVGQFYVQRLPPRWRAAAVAWFTLIGVSVLTTYQHHFIDIPTGILAACIVMWAVEYYLPSDAASRQPAVRAYRYAMPYFVLAALFSALAWLGGVWLWSLWPAAACLFYALSYSAFGAAAWQKDNRGRHSIVVRLLTLPVQFGVRANIAYWLRGKARTAQVLDNVSIGSLTAAEAFAAAVDLCAEYPCQAPAQYCSLPALDLLVPPPAVLAHAAAAVETCCRQGGAVLVCCALGYGRSAAAVLTWLIIYRGYDWQSACRLLQSARPEIVLTDAVQQAVLAAVQEQVK